MKHLIKIILVSLVLVVGIDFIVNFHRIKLDGCWAEIRGSLFDCETEYSQSYSDKKFLMIKVGMKESEVIDNLGKPLERFRPNANSRDYSIVNHIALRYSYSPPNKNCRVRNIIIANGKVIDKVYSLYIFD